MWMSVLSYLSYPVAVLSGILAMYLGLVTTSLHLAQAIVRMLAIIKVGYKQVDIGVAGIICTPERLSFVGYMNALILPNFRGWITKYPEKKSPSGNIIMIFDSYTWMLILISLIVASLVMLLISYVLRAMGFKKLDNVLVVLMPFSLLNAEAMPDWFLDSNKRVYSGSIFLLTWALASTILTFGFSSILRAILLAPSWEPYMDTSVQIAERKMTLLWHFNCYVKYDSRLTSHNPAVPKIINTAVFCETKEQVLNAIAEHGIENIVFDEGQEHNMNIMEMFPEVKFYVSKEKLDKDQTFWIIQKNSIWFELMNNHVLRCNQAGFETIALRILDSVHKSEGSYDLEKLSLEHVAVAFYILGLGLGSSILVFPLELLFHKKARII
ncbi:uncharacterized protein LOC111711987 [Eurytemora carolleeae]|uniref:uncharacterized protein LOC111711987 n=1 Tax=Eurytemora carolleeae TaxID=1294199 RepID=UPI000C78A0E5|nr:uncharacterized protein LOC111711987 [Eurytemora carolleeae]|eukprot:XP_023342257.1 uncharacterized protein LOC111711987 [Eurytemora affinis]